MKRRKFCLGDLINVKKTKFENQDCDESKGWQVSLGCSLADRLDKINSIQNLTTREIKRLLKDVLTNESVIHTLRRYIDGELREPETGELSASTRRKAKHLGIIPSFNDLDDQSNYHLQPRAITRSVTKRIQQSLQGQVANFEENAKQHYQQPSTILDMEFGSDKVRNILGDVSSDEEDDIEYIPNDSDLKVLKNDRHWDREEMGDNVQSPNDSLVSTIDEWGSNANSRDSVHTTTCFEEDSQDCAAATHSPHGTRSQVKFNSRLVGQSGNESRISFSLSNQLSYDCDQMVNLEVLPVYSSDAVCADNVASQPVDTDDVVRLNMYDEPSDCQDDVYAEFLRTLFASACPSTNTTPNKSNSQINCISKDVPMTVDGSITSPVAEYNLTNATLQSQLDVTKAAKVNNTHVDDDDDSDDPEFDVMAELDEVNREDLFYELRDDRAVRVSKLETRNLHDDLHEMFTDEVDSMQANKIPIPSVLVMKAHGQRFITERTLNRQRKRLNHSGGKITLDSSQMSESFASDCVQPWNVTSPKNVSFSFCLNERDLGHLERQLNMHVQQLATNFFLSYDFPALHQLVTARCATLLKKLVCKREAFDLVMSQEYPQLAKIPSFYWKCSILDQAIDLISDYSGLSMLPLFHPYCTKKSNRHILSSSQIHHTLPIPKCMLEMMLNSPIWSYAHLMPVYLGLASQTGTRLSAHSSEDALLILALATCPNLVIQTNRNRPSMMSSSSHGGAVKHKSTAAFGRSSQLVYHLISKYFLPHRTPLQLRTRRWNLFANRDLLPGITPTKHLPLATRYLYNICSHLTRYGNLLSNLVQNYADELTRLSIVRKLQPTDGRCLADQPTDALWNAFLGLPRDAGYEQVLNVTHEQREFRTESSECRRRILGAFFENAQCLWRSQMATANRTKRFIDQGQEFVIKPDEQDLDSNVLGPLYLPAIAVDMTPDGHITLNTSIEPSVIECNMKPTNHLYFMNQKMFSKPVYYANLISKGNHHIEEIMERVKNRHEQNDDMSQSNPNPLSQATKDPSGSHSCHITSMTMAQQPISLPVSTEAQHCSIGQDLLTVVHKTAENHLEVNQKFLNCLLTIFHFGLDRLHNMNGGLTRKFNSTIKTSVLNPYFNLNGSLTDQILTMLDLDKLASSTPSLNDTMQPSIQPSTSKQLTGLDSSSSQAIAVFPISSFFSSTRFITRCRARSEATTADLFTHPSSIFKQKQTTTDELDVRRARSLLDRCRTYLKPKDYNQMMDCLSYLNHVLQNQTVTANYDDPSFRTQGSQSRLILLPIWAVLDCLKNYRPLWEDFVCLLTPSQAQALGILATYFNLHRIGRIQQVFQDLVPRGKRFWRRLRNLADSCSNQTRKLPVLKRIAIHTNCSIPLEMSVLLDRTHTKCSTKSIDYQTTDNGNNNVDTNVIDSLLSSHDPFILTNCKSKRLRNVKSRSTTLLDSLVKSWSVLESSWRTRPLLLAQLGSFINPQHTPYSGFDQSFEECDLLARHCLDITNSAADINALQRHSNDIRVSDEVHSFLCEGWEVSTDLSVAARRRNGTTVWSRRNCPCTCHPNALSNNPPTSSSHLGKPAKADSLGLRHCIGCSLRVCRGIVYTDECNLHLKHVRIIWPENFKPKSILTPLSKSSRLSTTNPTSRCSHQHPNISTRKALQQLAQLHRKADFKMTDKTAKFYESKLPDMAKRHVSIRFKPTIKPKRTVHPSKSHVNKQANVKLVTSQDLDKPTTCHPYAPQPSNFDHQHKIKPNNSYSENPVSNPVWGWDDDDAACFNTEAFAPFSHQIEIDMDDHDTNDKQNAETSFMNNDDCAELTRKWTANEDRQLLEFCKAKGRYSSAMFKQLADIWKPEPLPGSPMRTYDELEMRFKELMRITLCETYDPELFRTPYRENSSSSDND